MQKLSPSENGGKAPYVSIQLILPFDGVLKLPYIFSDIHSLIDCYGFTQQEDHFGHESIYLPSKRGFS